MAFLAPLLFAAAVAAQPPLVGATPEQVKARFGEPAVASGEGKGAMWTYRRDACALMVFFKDEGRGLRVTSLTAAPRRRGEPTPALDACLKG